MKHAPPYFFDAPPEIHPERLWTLDQIGDPAGRVIVDVGCGTHKTLPQAIGVDVRPVTDLAASMDALPFWHAADVIIARHSLEHVLDVVGTLREWWWTLRACGRVILVLPNHGAIDTMHPFYSAGQHLHAFTEGSFSNLMRYLTFYRLEVLIPVVPDWSFGAVLRRVNG